MSEATYMKWLRDVKVRYLVIWSAVDAVLLLGVIGLWFGTSPPTVSVSVDTVDEYLSPMSDIRISFSRPFSRELTARIEPAVAGNWTYEDFLYDNHLARTLIFTPEVSLAPETEYRLVLGGVHSALTPSAGGETFTYTYTTPPVPTVVSVVPNADYIMPPNEGWSVTLGQPNEGLAAFEYVFEPEVVFEQAVNESKKVTTLKSTELLKQGTEYTLKVYRRKVQYFIESGKIAHQGDPEEVFSGTWKTTEAPGITAFSPTGTGIRRSARITIQFSEAMDQQSVLENMKIEPALAGEWEFNETNTEFTYTGSPALGTTYTVTIPAGTKTLIGGYLEEDAVYTFTTIGKAVVTRFSPTYGATGVSISSTVQVTFDQQVDHASAEGKFSINPNVDGTFSWDGNKMVFHPAGQLAFNASYTAAIGSGVKSLEALNSERDFFTAFTTELSQTKLTVPFHRQERPLSCEAAALLMALASKGVNVTESALIEQIGYDPTPHIGNVWGNPHIGFVGDYYGRQSTTGYGVYWEPISRVANLYRTSRWFANGTIQDLTAEIQKGNPVVVWGNAGSGKRVDWQTPQGDTVITINGEHTRVVSGFVGSADNPTEIIVMDPLYGERYYTTAAFEANWALLGKAGVVVE
ncbi:MAG: Ig-like domain-containing protein [Parcubacteria group bacterium]